MSFDCKNEAILDTLHTINKKLKFCVYITEQIES